MLFQTFQAASLRCKQTCLVTTANNEQNLSTVLAKKCNYGTWVWRIVSSRWPWVWPNNWPRIWSWIMERGKHVLSRQLWIVGSFSLKSVCVLCSLCVTWYAGLFPRVWFMAQRYLLLFLTQPAMMYCVFIRTSLSTYAANYDFHEHIVMTWISSVHHRHMCATEKKKTCANYLVAWGEVVV